MTVLVHFRGWLHQCTILHNAQAAAGLAEPSRGVCVGFGRVLLLLVALALLSIALAGAADVRGVESGEDREGLRRDLGGGVQTGG